MLAVRPQRLGPLGWLFARWVPPSEVRAEAWSLSNRYKGDPIRGACIELEAAGVSMRRAVLLRLVIHQARTERASL